MPTQYINPPTHTAGATAIAPVSVTSIGKSDFTAQLDDDLEDVFYNVDEFAGGAVWTYAKDGTTEQLTPIFDEEHIALDTDTGAPAIASEPQISVPTHQFAKKPEKGDTLTIRNRKFKVKEVLPDGTGVSMITLLRD